MDPSEIMRLETSRENWLVTSIVFITLTVLAFVSTLSYAFGKEAIRQKISHSGYNMTEVYTPTNIYYIIEKAN